MFIEMTYPALLMQIIPSVVGFLAATKINESVILYLNNNTAWEISYI